MFITLKKENQEEIKRPNQYGPLKIRQFSFDKSSTFLLGIKPPQDYYSMPIIPAAELRCFFEGAG